jgi:hypothetical protein
MMLFSDGGRTLLWLRRSREGERVNLGLDGLSLGLNGSLLLEQLFELLLLISIVGVVEVELRHDFKVMDLLVVFPNNRAKREHDAAPQPVRGSCAERCRMMPPRILAKDELFRNGDLPKEKRREASKVVCKTMDDWEGRGGEEELASYILTACSHEVVSVRARC